MDPLGSALACIALMLVMLNLGVPIAYSIGLSSAIIGYFSYGAAALEKLGWTTFHTVFNPAWTPLPLFAFMGSVVGQTKMGEDLFRAARLWFTVPGGLIIACIIAQAGIAATLGASAAAILAVGPVVYPELRKYGYDKRLSLGALTCSGLLGPLIPPSATAVIIAGLANLSLGPLLIAGVIPGVVLAAMLSLVPLFVCIKNPSLGPTPLKDVSWINRFGSLKRVWPVFVTFAAILGTIFLGIATVTEAGGVGALLILLLAVFLYRIKLKDIYKALLDTVKINAQLLFIIVGANFFAYIVGSSVLARQLSEFVVHSGLPPLLVVVGIQVVLLVLGCFIDGMTIMMITVPIFLPLVSSLGFDPYWFAILYLVNMEISLITPPMGINFFLVRNLFDISTQDLMRGVLPYLLVLICFLFLLIAFPQIVLWLPQKMITS